MTLSAGQRRVAVAVGLLALIAVPHVADPFQVTLVARGLVWATLAVSVWFLLRICSLPSLGHAAFFGIGAYTAGLAVTRWDVGNIFVALALAAAVTAALSVPIALVASRLQNVSFILVTLAFAEMTRSLVTRWKILGGTDGLAGITRPQAWPLGVDLVQPATYFYFAVVVLLICVAVLLIVVRSPFGAVLTGVRDSEQRMSALGYNPFFYRVAAFVLSATVAGVAGVVHAYLNRFASPTDVAPLVSARALLIVVVGGALIGGPVLFAVVLTVLEDALSSHTNRWLGVLGVLYIAVALVQGGWRLPGWRPWRRAKEPTVGPVATGSPEPSASPVPTASPEPASVPVARMVEERA